MLVWAIWFAITTALGGGLCILAFEERRHHMPHIQEPHHVVLVMPIDPPSPLTADLAEHVHVSDAEPAARVLLANR